ncbi:MAG TPA: hypothetical protein VHY84_14790 [Bryobacteraceae bacterium]|jgi:hypothetical protein|nr:hypothetical protein [Bryobacteraceae bacterium]
MMICTRCGNAGETGLFKRKGSGFIELLLWLCGIIPGLIYHLWRNGSSGRRCPACGSSEIVPFASPVGRELQQRFGVTETVIKKKAAAQSSDLRNGYIALAVIACIFVAVLLTVNAFSH